VIYGDNERLLHDLGIVVDDIVTELKGTRRKFDSIVVRGVSGLLVGPPVALALGKHLMIVRKPDEQSHDHTPVINAKCGALRAVFLDDFRCTGTTEHECHMALRLTKAKITHCYFYGGHYDDGWQRPRKGSSV
jgi:adenine/guanine phosphoribosyltransferase-like PRPP-binding protein